MLFIVSDDESEREPFSSFDSDLDPMFLPSSNEEMSSSDYSESEEKIKYSKYSKEKSTVIKRKLQQNDKKNAKTLKIEKKKRFWINRVVQNHFSPIMRRKKKWKILTTEQLSHSTLWQMTL